MGRYVPSGYSRERDGLAVYDANSCSGLLAHAITEHHRAHIRSLVEAGVDTRPLSGRWRFGGNEWRQLHGGAGVAEADASGG